MIAADSYYYMGKTHHYCQDYSIHCTQTKSYLNHPFVAISDGCSSSKDTDIGARLLLKTIYNNSLFSFDRGLYDSFSIAKSIAETMFLDSTCLDATILFAELTNPTCGTIGCSGDGFVIKINRNNDIEITEITFPSGAPYYLNYVFNEERKQLFIDHFSLKRLIKKYVISNGIVSQPIITKDTDGTIYYDSFTVKDYKYICVSSDGLAAFMEKISNDTFIYNSPLQPTDVIKQIIAFKNANGEFVKRRLLSFKKTCDSTNWLNEDDVSVGALYLGET